MVLTHLLTCPVCTLPLSPDGNMLTCINSHTFDVASEGYVNFLRKKQPGDTKEMLIARRQFLEQGYYQPLSDRLNELVSTRLSAPSPAILDAGCGEGYYIGRLQQHLTENFPLRQGEYIGIDISKEAIRLAAKRYRTCSFVVANLKEPMTIANSSLHVLLNIFAPRNADEFARVIMPGGLLIIAIPGPDHLLHLREELHLLNIEEQKQQRVMEQFNGSFELLTTTPLRYTLDLDEIAITQTVMMTPNFWHLSAAMREAMTHSGRIQTEADFICLLWRRK